MQIDLDPSQWRAEDGDHLLDPDEGFLQSLRSGLIQLEEEPEPPSTDGPIVRFFCGAWAFTVWSGVAALAIFLPAIVRSVVQSVIHPY